MTAYIVSSIVCATVAGCYYASAIVSLYAGINGALAVVLGG